MMVRETRSIAARMPAAGSPRLDRRLPEPGNCEQERGDHRQVHRLQVGGSGLVLDEEHGMAVVELVELDDALEAGDRVVAEPRVSAATGAVMPSAEPPLGRDLHHAAAAVGQQQVVLAVLLVDDHVERPVAIAQLGDGRPLDVGAGLQLGTGNLTSGVQV